METSIFQNLFNWAIQEFPPKLQLKMINLQCIHNNKLKGKCPEKNLGEFLYIPSHNLASLVPPHGKEPACSSGDPGSIPGSGRSPGEGNGCRLQYSCLENPVDRGVWWATVHGVAKSRTRLSDWTTKYCLPWGQLYPNYVQTLRGIKKKKEICKKCSALTFKPLSHERKLFILLVKVTLFSAGWKPSLVWNMESPVLKFDFMFTHE